MSLYGKDISLTNALAKIEANVLITRIVNNSSEKEENSSVKNEESSFVDLSGFEDLKEDSLQKAKENQDAGLLLEKENNEWNLVSMYVHSIKKLVIKSLEKAKSEVKQDWEDITTALNETTKELVKALSSLGDTSEMASLSNPDTFSIKNEDDAKKLLAKLNFIEITANDKKSSISADLKTLNEHTDAIIKTKLNSQHKTSETSYNDIGLSLKDTAINLIVQNPGESQLAQTKNLSGEKVLPLLVTA